MDLDGLVYTNQRREGIHLSRSESFYRAVVLVVKLLQSPEEGGNLMGPGELQVPNSACDWQFPIKPSRHLLASGSSLGRGQKVLLLSPTRQPAINVKERRDEVLFFIPVCE